MSIILLGVLLLYIFYKLVCLDDGNNNSDDCEDFIMMKDVSNFAKGDKPHNIK